MVCERVNLSRERTAFTLLVAQWKVLATDVYVTVCYDTVCIELGCTYLPCVVGIFKTHSVTV